MAETINSSSMERDPSSRTRDRATPTRSIDPRGSLLDQVIIRRALILLRSFPGVVTWDSSYTNQSYLATQNPPMDTQSTRNAMLPGTIYGMSMLHRSELSAPIVNLRMRGKDLKALCKLIGKYKGYRPRRTGSPKTALEYALVLKECRGKVSAATRMVNKLWYERLKV